MKKHRIIPLERVDEMRFGPQPRDCAGDAAGRSLPDARIGGRTTARR
ncbi:hypothetical protein GLE_2882 [Lysobacter enzymogenes]|uniref:Uncharacterized protein n=1 Tax=Lysobacter enzymogenes TaxID=69 RepID=A0A0S2DHV0_LYSEN|nr:hypothetical protein GLE_2882 [Lysobacter enzymogenes]